MFKPCFLNKPVKVTPESVKNNVLSLNGKTFAPITEEKSNQIILKGKVYVPVKTVPAGEVGTKNVITTNQVKKVNTFEVGSKTYIPLERIPKCYRPIFNDKVEKV